MVDLGCQGTDLVGGNDKDDSMRFYYESLILAPFSRDKGKCGDLGCISGCFGFSGGPLGSEMVDLCTTYVSF